MKYVNKAVWKVKIKILYAAKKFQLDSLLDLIVLKLNAAVEPVDVAHIFIAGIEKLDWDFKIQNVGGHQVPREDGGALYVVQQNTGESCRASVSFRFILRTFNHQATIPISSTSLPSIQSLNTPGGYYDISYQSYRLTILYSAILILELIYGRHLRCSLHILKIMRIM